MNQAQRFSRAGSRQALTIVGTEPAMSATLFMITASSGSPEICQTRMLIAAVARQPRSSQDEPPSPRRMASRATTNEPMTYTSGTTRVQRAPAAYELAVATPPTTV